MNLKKLTLAALTTLALGSSAFAAESAAQSPMWGIGAGAFKFAGSTTPVAVVTYLDSQFLVQGGAGYDGSSVSGTSAHVINTFADFGLRDMLNNQVSFDYGVSASYGFVSHKDGNAKDPYSMGAFTGLDFMPVQNVLVVATIQPYTYARDGANNSRKSSHIFSAGSASISYMFS